MNDLNPNVSFFQTELAEQCPPPNLGIYIHVPFCVEKCPYCDFISGPVGRSQQDSYLETLSLEILGSPFHNIPVETLFFGGGTPSEVQSHRISELMQLLRDCFDFSQIREATIECNPGTLTFEKLACFEQVGFNRISLGAQSFNDIHLRKLGRIHKAEDTFKAYELICQAGFQNVNLDLMFGLIDQTLEEFKSDLDHSLKLAPQHLSLYHLTIEKGTPYFDGVQSGRLRPVDENIASQMFRYACKKLTHSEYHQYEISNFALKGKQCQHNQKYWTNRATLGFGVSASSYIGGVRWTNTLTFNDYLTSTSSKRVPLEVFEKLPPRAALGEEMMLGLRTEKGLDLDLVSEKYGLDAHAIFSEKLREFERLKLLARHGPKIKLTRQGLLLADSVCAEFLEG
jgi:oxygen-independent coproporphyrinogen-3 oxidase